MRSSFYSGVGADDDALDGSTDACSGLAVDDSRFGVGGGGGSFTGPWSGAGVAELDETCASDDSADFPDVSKISAAAFSNSPSPTRFPNAVIASLCMCTTPTAARESSCASTGAARAKSMMGRMRRTPEAML
jgi:hypothetical protein